MNATHKTFSGMTKAVERTIEELGSATIDNDRDYQAFNKRIKALNAELNALWSNPADASEADQLRNALNDAWNAATD